MDSTSGTNNKGATTVAEVKGQTKAEEGDYESLDRLIDSITRDFSRKGINSRLKVKYPHDEIQGSI
jgi:hypothetical protein